MLHRSERLDQRGRGYTPFRENDVIFAKITPCMENGKIALATGLKNGIAYGSTEFLVFRPYKGILPRFVLHFLLQPSFREAAEKQMSGASGQKRVPAIYLFNHEFLLPPTLEQDRIVAKLDAALSRVERAENASRRAQERLKRYRAAVLNAAATGDLTRAWREAQREDQKAGAETAQDLLQRIRAVRRSLWRNPSYGVSPLKVSGRGTISGNPDTSSPTNSIWQASLTRLPTGCGLVSSNLASLSAG